MTNNYLEAYMQNVKGYDPAEASAENERRQPATMFYTNKTAEQSPDNPFRGRTIGNFARVGGKRISVSVADSDLRNDRIEAALKDGNDPIMDHRKRVGWMNTRVDLMVNLEERKLLDILNRVPSREECLANIIRRECADKSPQEQFELSLLDPKIDPDKIRPMFFGKDDTSPNIRPINPIENTADDDYPEEQEQEQALPEPPSPPVIVEKTAARGNKGVQRKAPARKTASAPVVTEKREDPQEWMPEAEHAQPEPLPEPQGFFQLAQAVQPPQPHYQQANYNQEGQHMIKLPGDRNTAQPAPRQAAPAPQQEEKYVKLICPWVSYKLPVRDIVVEQEYIVIVQKEGASVEFTPGADHTVYRIEGFDFGLEFSGISFRQGGNVYTIMIIQR